MNPEPPPGPLVLGAEPYFLREPWRERQRTDLTEIIGNQFFVYRIRVDPVPGLPDPDDAGGFRLEDEEIVKRLSSRRVCVSCGASYNTITQPPKKDSVCDKCGGKGCKECQGQSEAQMAELGNGQGEGEGDKDGQPH